ncbi:MAG: RNA polymerase sigma factor [Kiloniellales bacterium]|nr:RNA polymerase sigma factor [Kiloniellales bacterium]
MRSAERHRLEPYLKRLFGFAYGLSGEREQARDLVQECALKALAAHRTPRDEPAYRAWLFTILRNLFIDRQRSNREAPAVPDPERAPESWEIWRSDEYLMTALTVRLAMAKLSAPHREIIALVDLAGFSYAETAALLGVPAGTVMSRLSRARQALLGLIIDNNVRELPRQRGGESR